MDAGAHFAIWGTLQVCGRSVTLAIVTVRGPGAHPRGLLTDGLATAAVLGVWLVLASRRK
jgi:hypothetical protein